MSTDKFQVGNITVHILHGDITKETTDCTINSSNESLDLKLGIVSQTLAAQGGPDFLRACQGRSADMKSKGLALTSSGNLKCKYVLHIVAPKSEIGWFQIIKKIIDLAVANGFASLSFPALGTGDMNRSPEIMANIFAETVVKFVESNKTSNLKQIRVVVFQEKMVSTFTCAFATELFPKATGVDDAYSRKSNLNSMFVKSSLMAKELPLLPGEQEAMAGNKVVYFPLHKSRSFTETPEEFHYRTAESQFYRKIGSLAEKYDIGLVKYVVNPELNKRFRTAQQMLKKTRGEDLSHPVLAFHGTTAENVRKICENGFLCPGDPEFKRMTDSGFFGAGVYFSGYAGYSMPYALRTDPPYLILCQVLLGKIYQCTDRLDGQKCIAGYDSHISPKGKELIVFNPSHILPVYIVQCHPQTNKTVDTDRE